MKLRIISVSAWRREIRPYKILTCIFPKLRTTQPTASHSYETLQYPHPVLRKWKLSRNAEWKSPKPETHITKIQSHLKNKHHKTQRKWNQRALTAARIRAENAEKMTHLSRATRSHILARARHTVTGWASARTCTSSENSHHLPPGKIDGMKPTHFRILSRNSSAAFTSSFEASRSSWTETPLMDADFKGGSKITRREAKPGVVREIRVAAKWKRLWEGVVRCLVVWWGSKRSCVPASRRGMVGKMIGRWRWVLDRAARFRGRVRCGPWDRGGGRGNGTVACG